MLLGCGSLGESFLRVFVSHAVDGKHIFIICAERALEIA